MRIAYFDCFSGASGNMILGALCDAGLPLDALERELRKLPVSGFVLRHTRVDKRGLAALHLDVEVPGEDGHVASHPAHSAGHHHHEGLAHRTLADIVAILRAAHLPAEVEATAEKIYRRLAVAEARVHGSGVEEIAFHEVGQVDAMVDITGAAIALHLLGIEKVYCSALPCGTGRIRSAHGEGPSPAPATMDLLRDAPTYALDVDGEFVTPTGAAILSSIASFDTRPPMIVRAIGYGAGTSDFPFPNVLRVMLGETLPAAHADGASSAEHVVQLETNIDDMNPQLYEHVSQRLFASGALDVWTQAVMMKKGRPGIVLACLAPGERGNAVAAVMLAETTSIGVRQWEVRRTTLARSIKTIDTTFGPVQVKIVEGPGGKRVRPEYEDVRRIADREGKALTDVMARVEREVAESVDGG
jgi:pyridinium-3,5-bisthiocarboxylic acid mononucleotide nickel chelatase